MLSFIKAKGQMLGLAILAAQLATIALASPFNLGFDDEVPAALARAGSGNGDCREGLCKNGTCTIAKLGEACVVSTQCDGTLLCGNNKCYAPSKGVLSAYNICKADAQCLSGQCVFESTTINYEGVKDLVMFRDLRPDVKNCDLIRNGQPGCKSYRDCITGLCQNGTCVAGKDGDRCHANYQCQNLCGLDGHCFKITKPQGQDQICGKGSDCLSGTCEFDFEIDGGTRRPTIDLPGTTSPTSDPLCVGGAPSTTTTTTTAKSTTKSTTTTKSKTSTSQSTKKAHSRATGA